MELVLSCDYSNEDAIVSLSEKKKSGVQRPESLKLSANVSPKLAS